MNATDGLLFGLPNERLPTWNQLPILDLWGSIATEDEIISRGWRDINRLGVCSFSAQEGIGSYSRFKLQCSRTFMSTTLQKVL